MPATALPTTDQLRAELARSRKRERTLRALASTVAVLVVVAALAVLLSFVKLPLLEVTGESMSPTLQPGEYVLAERGGGFETGDMVAFYFNNKILVKRVIATSGQWVDIDDMGNVSVDGQPLDEPYLPARSYGNVSISLPYQVPESSIFVMGDNRDVSLDSRSREVGCVYEEQVVGRVFARVWPLQQAGRLQQARQAGSLQQAARP